MERCDFFTQGLRLIPERCARKAHSRQDGHLLLVVPAIESILMERYNELGQQLHESKSCQNLLDSTLPEQSAVMDLHQGG